MTRIEFQVISFDSFFYIVYIFILYYIICTYKETG